MKLKLLFTWRPERGLERIAACLPDIDVQISEDRAEILRLIPEAEVACVGHFDGEIFRAAKKLRWVQAFSGGVNSLLFPEFVASPVPMTCLKGCFGSAAAEHALAVMLAYATRLEYDIRRRSHRTFTVSDPFELKGKTVGIVGLGDMGLEIAKKCRAFGMQVIGLARRVRPCPDGVDQMLPLPELLAASDFVVVAVPLTAATQGLIGEAQFRAMKPGAYLVDISGRPAVYDLPALERALRDRRIAGASLQLVPVADSPLWDLENLLLSFHRVVSGEQYDDCVEMFCENLRRYRAGQPLLGVVDKQAGY